MLDDILSLSDLLLQLVFVIVHLYSSFPEEKGRVYQIKSLSLFMGFSKNRNGFVVLRGYHKLEKKKGKKKKRVRKSQYPSFLRYTCSNR